MGIAAALWVAYGASLTLAPRRAAIPGLIVYGPLLLAAEHISNKKALEALVRMPLCGVRIR